MDCQRTEKILHGIHSYFLEFYKQGMVYVQDTEMMARDLLEKRKHHEEQLLNGMYWTIFSLHLLYRKYDIATPEQREHNRAQDSAMAAALEEEDCDDAYDSVNHDGYIPATTANRASEDGNSAETRPADNFHMLRYSNHAVLGAELDTPILKGKDVDAILRFLKMCQREFVYEEYTYMGFANSDDRRRFSSNISSTLMAINAYRVIGDYLKVRSSLGYLKHMAWVYQVDELLAYINLLYVRDEGFYRKTVLPLIPESADIRHTASAVLATSILLRMSGHQNENYRRKIGEWINIAEVTKHVMKHFNDDGGIGMLPNAESHCGAAFCAIAVLTVLGTLLTVPRQRLIDLRSWLLRRIAHVGGVAGRIGKPEDVCYSFWVLASLTLMNQCGIRSQILRGRDMIRFIERCQTPCGGIAPFPCDSGRPGEPDPFHSFAALMTITLIEEDRQQAAVSVLQTII
uniref:Geranylgeranyl transferase type II subunit beta n=1 Tax=Amblyomma aureolatum TaxID=187763 RepID=A0A1E1XH48_9ACAR